MSQREHALLSASASHRWLICTPCARLEDELPETTSAYAEEGRIAHALAELKLRKHFYPLGPKKFREALAKLQAQSGWQDEMEACTGGYLDYVQQKAHAYAAPPHVAIEQRLNYDAYAPEGFGTGDCVIIGGSTLHVIDYKHGKGVPVFAQDNPQMKLYALGALDTYAPLYQIDTVRMTIFQPRLDTISEWETSAEALRQWGEVIKPIAKRAFEGGGEFVSGEHCRFCRAKATCRARAEANTALAAYAFKKPPLLSNGEVGAILKQAVQLAAWAADLQEYSLHEVLAGREVPGWKAVEGRSNRQFSDVDAALAAAGKAGVDEALLYKRVPITLTETEKLMGKKEFSQALGAYVVKPPGKPTLAPLEDARSPLTTNNAADVFAADK